MPEFLCLHIADSQCVIQDGITIVAQALVPKQWRSLWHSVTFNSVRGVRQIEYYGTFLPQCNHVLRFFFIPKHPTRVFFFTRNAVFFFFFWKSRR